MSATNTKQLIAITLSKAVAEEAAPKVNGSGKSGKKKGAPKKRKTQSLDFHRTDSGNAEMFARLYGDRVYLGRDLKGDRFVSLSKKARGADRLRDLLFPPGRSSDAMPLGR